MTVSTPAVFLVVSALSLYAYQAQAQEAGSCTPFELPPQFSDFGQLCQYLTTVPDAEVVEQFDQGRFPGPIGEGRTPMLAGCTAGCVVGNSQAAEQGRSPMFAGGWSGKCLQGNTREGYPTEVQNILTTNAADRDWSEPVAGTLGLPGAVFRAPSWQDQRSALILDYTDIPAEQLLLIDYNNFRDELRWVAPGMLVGQIWLKPNTEYNPSSQPRGTGIWFALFQVCNARGGYARSATDRVLTRAAPRQPPPLGFTDMFGGGGFPSYGGGGGGFGGGGDAFSIPGFFTDFFDGGGGR